jgi:hypothetical protein
MPANIRFDHALVLVSDLAAASQDYARLGFSVLPGGEHEASPTHNALIPFADGSYLELLAFRAAPGEPAADLEVPSRLDRRVRRWRASGDGLIDFALRPANLEEALQDARGRGLHLDGPIPGGRRRPDGQQVAWQSAVPDRLDLPFLIADVTPHELRVPAGDARVHPNGAVGIRGAIVTVADPDAVAACYEALLGVAVPALAVQFGAGYVRLLPMEGSEEAGTEGLHALVLWTHDASRVGRLDRERAHGARLSLEMQR